MSTPIDHTHRRRDPSPPPPASPPPGPAPSTPAPASQPESKLDTVERAPAGDKVGALRKEIRGEADLKDKSRELMRQFDGKVAQIKRHSAYQALGPGGQAKVDAAIADARKRPDLNQRAQTILAALDAPKAPSSLAPVDVTAIDDREHVEWNRAHPGAVGGFRNPKEMVDRVLDAAGDRPIKTLTVIDHGGPGYQEMGNFSESVSLKDMKDPKTREAFLGQLGRLKRHLASDATIHLGGCKTGLGESGTGYMKEIAKATGANVEAAHELQYPSVPGTDPEISDYEGPWTTCRPGSTSLEPECAVTDPRQQLSYLPGFDPNGVR